MKDEFEERNGIRTMPIDMREVINGVILVIDHNFAQPIFSSVTL